MTDIQIRPAVSSDLGVAAKFDRDYQTTRVWQLDRNLREGEFQASLREIRLPRSAPIKDPYTGEELILRPNAYDGILVASLDDRLSGYACLRNNHASGTTWILELVVDGPMRNRSIATALLLASRDWAEHVGMRKICLEMQSKNYPGICLAKKLGYEFSGYLDQYYSNQDIALFFSNKV